MEVKYLCPYWGSEKKSAGCFLEEVLLDGYDGVEINPPDNEVFITEFMHAIGKIRSLHNRDFKFIAQQVLEPAKETAQDYTVRMVQKLEHLSALRPDFINAHTGKDYYSFDENCRIIEKAETISFKTGIPVLHEIHRGRFTFHSRSLLAYLETFPEMKLTADFSHWCTVSESMLEEQQEIIEKVIPFVYHIHSRIGFEQGPQVNDPFAPEWENHMGIFISWWQQILDHQSKKRQIFTVTPEFGPIPYMPTLPFSRQPLTNQWETNKKIKDLLKTKLNLCNN
jgi:hypothetical protein